MPEDVLDDKIGILDIKAKINNSINCDIEMQVVDRKNIEERVLFYCSKMYVQSLSSGQDYSKLEKSITILLTDYEIKSLKEIKKYMTKWNIREQDYGNIILTDAMEVYIIELPKFEKYKTGSTLDPWVKFIKDSKVIDMSNKEIKKAKKVLEEISQDEHERYLAELREKYILDQKNIEATGYDKGLKQGKEEGIKEGIKKGREEGKKEGKEESKKEIAKEMIKEKMPLEVISKITKIPKKELQEIKKEI